MQPYNLSRQTRAELRPYERSVLTLVEQRANSFFDITVAEPKGVCMSEGGVNVDGCPIRITDSAVYGCNRDQEAATVAAIESVVQDFNNPLVGTALFDGVLQSKTAAPLRLMLGMR